MHKENGKHKHNSMYGNSRASSISRLKRIESVKLQKIIWKGQWHVQEDADDREFALLQG